MNSVPVVVLFVAAMVAVIVGLDVAFLRGHVWARLAVNVGVVLVFALVYLGLHGRPWRPGR